ncbi:MAG TPA: glycosyltransferase family 1 protein [Patescibacteria group bacterium]|nr:glycosyltransferase family 1 protein [Patescibacteria group bacterium]
MRILIDARFYGLENAGLGRYTINLLEQLQRLDKTNQYIILLRKKYFDNLNFNKNFEKVIVDIPHYSLKEHLELSKIIEKQNPDLVHFLHFNAPLNFNGKFIVTIHDMTMHSQKTNASNLSLPKYFVKHFIYKKVFNHAIKSSEKIIVPSEFVKDELIKNFKIEKTKVKVIYEGISQLSSHKNFENLRISTSSPDLSKFSSVRLDKLYFLYVGNVYPHKNLEIAIKAFANMKINFIIVTKKNNFRVRLEKLVDKLNAQKYILFLENMTDENLKELYEKSVGFIYPSLSEGFGLQGLEAMNVGTILLCSSIPVFREIYGNHAVYFDPVDQKSIENAIEQTMKLTKQNAEKMIRENKKFITRYSWEKMAKETLEVYEQYDN